MTRKRRGTGSTAVALAAALTLVAGAGCGEAPRPQAGESATGEAVESRATLVVTAIPEPGEEAAAQQYLRAVVPLLKGAGGKPVRRLKTNRVINGRAAGVVLVMDFPSEDAVAGLFESADYQALIPGRDRGFKEMNILIGEAF